MSYLLFFPKGFFEEDIQDILKMCITLKILKKFVLSDGRICHIIFSLIFPLGFKGVLVAYLYIFLIFMSPF